MFVYLCSRRWFLLAAVAVVASLGIVQPKEYDHPAEKYYGFEFDENGLHDDPDFGPVNSESAKRYGVNTLDKQRKPEQLQASI